MLADRMVLVGDHCQLQPVVRSPLAARSGMRESWFERLCLAHPVSVKRLCRQYRMCRQINAVTSSLVYGNRMVCGSPAVAQARLQLDRAALQAVVKKATADASTVDPSAANWLVSALQPACPFLFLNTSNLPAPESQQAAGFSGKGRYNSTEVRLVMLRRRGSKAINSYLTTVYSLTHLPLLLSFLSHSL